MRDSRDYRWIRTAYPSWFADGYCATLIKADLEAVLSGLGGGYRRQTSVGLSAGFAECGKCDEDCALEQVIGLSVVTGRDGEWTLLAQSPSAYIGIEDEPMLAVLGERYELVSHSHNIAGYGQFVWWRDGTRQIAFEPMLAPYVLASTFPAEYRPPGRDTVVELIERTGGISVESTDQTSDEYVEGSFALADAISGVHLTRQLLDSAEFTWAVVAMRPGQRWDRQRSS